MEFLIKAFISLMPSIVGPVLCMIILKTRFLISLNKPIDNNIYLKDGKRLFGDNKTIRGLIIYILATSAFSVIWGLICSNISFLSKKNLLYIEHNNTLLFNFFVGFLYGIAYPIFELPNSFIKRRFDVSSKNIEKIKGIKKYIFNITDLIDSSFGCVLVFAIFYKITFLQYLLLVFLGGLIHYVIITILYRLKIKDK